jgi:hypothetical protein
VRAEVSTHFRATTSHAVEGDLTNSILIVPPGIFKSWADADTPKERNASMGIQLLAILPRLLSGNSRFEQPNTESLEAPSDAFECQMFEILDHNPITPLRYCNAVVSQGRAIGNFQRIQLAGRAITGRGVAFGSFSECDTENGPGRHVIYALSRRG